MIAPILNIPVAGKSPEQLMEKEWLVTNGLGGYSSGTVAGINTRRYHGLFVPDLPMPRGRTLLLPLLAEYVVTSNHHICLDGAEYSHGVLESQATKHLQEFRLDWLMPTWIYELPECALEKQVFMPYGCNTVCVRYRLLRGGKVQLRLRPYGACRKHDSLGAPREWPFTLSLREDHYEMRAFEDAPALRLTLRPFRGIFVAERQHITSLFYRMEANRGLDSVENLVSPGVFSLDLHPEESIFFVASTDEWERLEGDPTLWHQKEMERKQDLLGLAAENNGDPLRSQLVLAADQFIICPWMRSGQSPAGQAEAKRTVIAGYHWFTDWGRDTMISLEGLTLVTGRHEEAKAILRTFAQYVRHGLLPNHFPEASAEAIYNTVDATFWYFHAIDRYLAHTQNTELLHTLYPALESIIDHHVQGTDFGIHLDPADSLICASADGYQLTWMDAKVDEWVVTPRRGKPVEIQALWYNALKLMEHWSQTLGKPAGPYTELANQVYTSFNRRFWNPAKGCLFDVVDGRKPTDASLRPNQILALSLRFPVLEPSRWASVVEVVERALLTPYGLRTLAPDDKDYHGHYEGNRWERDAAYHQGLVWTWLIGPFFDAWVKVHPDPAKAQEFFRAFADHLQDAGLGSISEIFDADRPYRPRGCIAQAWSVAEVLRCLVQLNNQRLQGPK